jgi:hypothetical protein
MTKGTATEARTAYLAADSHCGYFGVVDEATEQS